MKEKTLKCCDCQNPFVFSVGEQKFFDLKGLLNQPKRCPNCRLFMRFVRSGKDIGALNEVECAECGNLTKVPFKPRGHRPVLCFTCLKGHEAESLPVEALATCAAL